MENLRRVTKTRSSKVRPSQIRYRLRRTGTFCCKEGELTEHPDLTNIGQTDCSIDGQLCVPQGGRDALTSPDCTTVTMKDLQDTIFINTDCIHFLPSHLYNFLFIHVWVKRLPSLSHAEIPEVPEHRESELTPPTSSHESCKRVVPANSFKQLSC